MIDVIQVSVRRELLFDRLRDQLPRRSRRVVSVLLTTAVAVDVCGVMRREGKGTGQMIDPHPQCMVHSADIRHRHRHRHRGGVSNKTPPPTELQISAIVTTLLLQLVMATLHSRCEQYIFAL